MNHAPLIFLGSFFALALSWFGMILQPQLQLGRAQPATNIVSAQLYPGARPGLAQQGLQVYRSLGCASCHSQQVRQTGTVFDVVLSNAGTNQEALVQALLTVKSDLNTDDAKRLFGSLPETILKGVDKPSADAAVEKLRVGDAKAEVQVVPVGPDIARGWGRRRSVAADFLYDETVLLGSQRLGPDLANVASWKPGADWHLLHLYNPRIVERKSVMPPYRFLFEQRRAGTQPSPEALKLSGELAPPSGYEIVPKAEANALVGYLLSLRADGVLFETPMAAPAAAATAVPTNAPISAPVP